LLILDEPNLYRLALPVIVVRIYEVEVRAPLKSRRP